MCGHRVVIIMLNRNVIYGDTKRHVVVQYSMVLYIQYVCQSLHINTDIRHCLRLAVQAPKFLMLLLSHRHEKKGKILYSTIINDSTPPSLLIRVEIASIRLN